MTDYVWCEKHKHYANETDFPDKKYPCHFCGEDHFNSPFAGGMCLCMTLMPDEFREMRRKRQEAGFD